jgi:pilus assembly protein Flp/PilA
MKTLLIRIRKFLARDDGPTAVEYAVMLALIVIVCLSTITIIGTRSNGVFNTVANRLPAGS